MTMPVDPLTEHLHDPIISCDTALSCLVRLGVCKGDDQEIEAFRRRAILDGNTLPVTRLIELVGTFGVQAECRRLDWNGLTKGEVSYPILVFLNNTNAVVVTGTDSAAAEPVSVWDPLHSDGEVFSVQHEDFERAWSGDVLTIARQPPTEADASLDSSEGQNIEIVEPLPQRRSERAPAAEAQLLPGSVPVARRAKPGRLVVIGLAAAAVIGVPLWIHAVTGDFGTIVREAKEEIAEDPQSALSTAEAAVHPKAPGAVASTATGPMPQVVPSVETPAAAAPAGGAVLAVAPGTAAPPPEPAPDIARAAAAEPGNGPAAAPATAALMREPAPDIARPVPVETPTGPAYAVAPAATPSVNVAAAPLSAGTPPVDARLSAAETAMLLARGDVLFSTGDLVAARLFYERAADAGEAQAAVRLGETFDPNFIDHVQIRGAHGNVEAALSWYRRARDLGAAEAEFLLNSLQAQ